MSLARNNNSRYNKKRSKKFTETNSKSFSISSSPISLTKRLITQKIPKIKNEFGFFNGINVNSAVRTSSKHHSPEKLPDIYLDNDSIYEIQYQELVESILEKGNKTFQFEKFSESHENKNELEPISLKNFKLCGRFNKKPELRTRSLLPQTIARMKIKKPLRKEKFNIDGIQALVYQKISGKASANN